MSVCAIIAAAGRGERLGGPLPKQFVEIDQKPILVYTVEKFCQSELIDSIVMVVPEDWRELVEQRIITQFGLTKISHIVTGGSTRQASIANALATIDKNIETVVIHDAVRPLISQDLLHKVIEKGKETGAAVVAVPIYDSIKKVTNLQIVQTLARESAWLIQTPQVFQRELIVKAYRLATLHGIVAADDSALVECLNYPIQVVEGSRINIKITMPEDLTLAKVLLRSMN